MIGTIGYLDCSDGVYDASTRTYTFNSDPTTAFQAAIVVIQNVRVGTFRMPSIVCSKSVPNRANGIYNASGIIAPFNDVFWGVHFLASKFEQTLTITAKTLTVT